MMKDFGAKKTLSPREREELRKTLQARFEKNMNRHKGLDWVKVKAKLEATLPRIRQSWIGMVKECRN